MMVWWGIAVIDSTTCKLERQKPSSGAPSVQTGKSQIQGSLAADMTDTLSEADRLRSGRRWWLESMGIQKLENRVVCLREPEGWEVNSRTEKRKERSEGKVNQFTPPSIPPSFPPLLCLPLAERAVSSILSPGRSSLFTFGFKYQPLYRCLHWDTQN